MFIEVPGFAIEVRPVYDPLNATGKEDSSFVSDDIAMGETGG